MNRRALMRGAAAVPAAIMGLAKASREALGGLPVAMHGHGDAVDSESTTQFVGVEENPLKKMARAALKELERKQRRTSIGNLGGIDMDLWSLRSVSWQHRARMQAERTDAYKSEVDKLSKLIWGEEF